MATDEFKCASDTLYGTEVDVPGNELGHLVGITDCVGGMENHDVIHVKRGDKVRLDGWYWVGENDARIAPVPGGAHLVIMSHMFFLFKPAAALAANLTSI